MFSKPIQSLPTLAIGILFAAVTANGAMIQPGTFVEAGRDTAAPVHLIPVGNDKYLMREQRRDAFTKHNPNAAAISQMLGGARSIDIPGGFGLSPRHYAWCFRQYGSYNMVNNSFVDVDGTRQECRSPYL